MGAVPNEHGCVVGGEGLSCLCHNGGLCAQPSSAHTVDVSMAAWMMRSMQRMMALTWPLEQGRLRAH